MNLELLERNITANPNTNLYAIKDKVRFGDLLPVHLQVSEEEHSISDKEHEQDDLQNSSELADEVC